MVWPHGEKKERIPGFLLLFNDVHTVDAETLLLKFSTFRNKDRKIFKSKIVPL
jgi:hypothetical protein